MVRYLCGLARVSRSGFYAWLKAAPKRQNREKQDQADLERITSIFNSKNQKAGIRQIKMVLENEYGLIMNLKKIVRLMRKEGLKAKIRRINPYKRLGKATQEHQTCPNVLNRNFDQGKPGKVFLTDITYLQYGNGQVAYLSCLKDGSTKEVLAHYLSTTLGMEIVYQTINRLKQFHHIMPESILHSDQGFHYTNPDFQKNIKNLGIIQSMSRKGNCWDNAPMEAFFGTLKDEVDHRACKTLKELTSYVDGFIKYYNQERYQWGLGKMSPVQYRTHLIAA